MELLQPIRSEEHQKKLLSTSSPEAIKVALKITPTRLANLLIRKGPLPIRHITSQLAIEVPGFDLLSLSKQRRLIMAAMDQTDLENNVVFEKIGWGQWAVRKVDSDYIVTEGTEKDTSIKQEQQQPDTEQNKINVHDLRNQSGLKLGWSKKQQPKLSNPGREKLKQLNSSRRESITNNRSNLHNLKIPNESLNNSNAIVSDSEDDFALGNDDDDDEDAIDEDSSDEADASSNDELFTFDHDDEINNGSSTINKFKKIKSPPIKFANRVPLKLSPPPPGGSNTPNNGSMPSSRRKSSSSIIKNTHSYNHNQTRHQIFNRSRLNSIENLDNYILSSAKNSNVSINSPPPSASHAALLLGSPTNSWTSSGNYIHNANNHQNSSPLNNATSLETTSADSIAATISSAGRRKSSFNESHIRSTLSSLLSSPPKYSNSSLLKPPYDLSSHTNSSSSVIRSNGLQPPASTYSRSLKKSSSNPNQSDTDEEDWATIGAESLRKQQENDHVNSNNSNENENGSSRNKNLDAEERTAAAIALVDLMSV
ncbi:hypothetical protein HYPBUDRAFT_155847 [Hyphopichia burtonii NRRL Y-1933]|uniref:Sin3 binding protein n=1 Tax=Hyphopichia burtonii NRRL Y-1933 TaxID=984485 RepID=A0A1E4RNG4_9ASCO|nr:hypothetical protein HYPBUDRAFT_155847 [Hyphopichia burtonii NRRL Y-1933]ODV68807.1 hypothetical protein HYPBUDRAFT_155847 [Hyphopichia burtonii NRRL Y-1933]